MVEEKEKWFPRIFLENISRVTLTYVFTPEMYMRSSKSCRKKPKNGTLYNMCDYGALINIFVGLHINVIIFVSINLFGCFPRINPSEWLFSLPQKRDLLTLPVDLW